MMTEVVGCGAESLRVGMALEVAFRAEEGRRRRGRSRSPFLCSGLLPPSTGDRC